MDAMSSGVGLVPEQAWEDPDLTASPFGSDPTTASIGFVDGQAAGSASPLTWAQAQEVRLTQSLAAGTPVERPSIVAARYAGGSTPTAAIAITTPASGSTVDTATASVTGTATPGAKVDLAVTPTDTGAATTHLTTTATHSGAWSATVPASLGANVLTAAATKGAATGYAQSTFVSSFVSGTVVLDVSDPDGDDDGPGTYQYPLSSSFTAGAFDLERFQVITTDTDVVLRATLRDLTPTFGSPLGAQLLDVFVHDPSATTTSTAAPFASRNFGIAEDSAWSQRVEVQGFASPVYVDASGASLPGAAVTASQAARTITILLPKSSAGTPSTGWRFAVALTGQDGFSGDQARAFAATAQDFAFGVCAPGGSSPICGLDPNTVPKVVDVLTPDGVSQSTELDPTQGSVAIEGVPVG
jgi:hypothetical protein